MSLLVNSKELATTIQENLLINLVLIDLGPNQKANR
jgi:hypothetical protein